MRLLQCTSEISLIVDLFLRSASEAWHHCATRNCMLQFYICSCTLQTKRDHLEWTAEDVTAHLRAQYNQMSNTEKEEWRERAIQDM